MVGTRMGQQLETSFAEHFGQSRPRVFRAPGRVNLIGEHTDYNDGFVLPVAIDRQVLMAVRPREDDLVRLWSMQFSQMSQFSLAQITYDHDAPWSNYCRGVAHILQESGFTLCGMDAAVAGDVPIGSGLSSSAALEVATAVAFQGLCHLAIGAVELARLCQRAENEFVGMNCGIMDQFIAALGQPHCALLIDCRSLAYEPVPLPANVSVVICDTMKRRGLVASEYNARRRECEQGVELLRRHLPAIRALRDVSSADLVRFGHLLPDTVLKRCRHVVSENERTQHAVAALRAGELATLGTLMEASHASLRDDYAVSCEELDVMVELAKDAPGCVGTRMTGAGFGGCTVSLVRADAAARFVEKVSAGYSRRMGVQAEVYVCQASSGAGELG